MCQNQTIIIFILYFQIYFFSIKTTYQRVKTEVKIIKNIYINASKTFLGIFLHIKKKKTNRFQMQKNNV